MGKESNEFLEALVATGEAPRRLTRDEVAIKYAPPGDPDWTAEWEAAFFESLPKAASMPPKGAKSGWLIEEYARGVLAAKRLSAGYVNALRLILTAFAVADETGADVRVSQRMEQYGTPQAIRTIQAQMHGKGLLVKEVREQGGGFVGAVYVYAPVQRKRFRRATVAEIEASFRSREQRTAAYPDHALASTGIADVPF